MLEKIWNRMSSGSYFPPPVRLVEIPKGNTGKTRPLGIPLLPAWPDDWNVDFKLHAPRQTVVEGRVRDGKLVSWTVTPKRRNEDVIVAGPDDS